MAAYSWRRRVPSSLLALGLSLVVVWLGAPAAVADDVPYTDLAAHGSVGLCDASGKPVTHGNINDKPFVWRAVSSAPAQAPYDATGRTATLVAYQPRTGAYPNQWSGDTLTSSSTYTNPQYPMAQATPLDFSLADFLGEFPANWNGLVQLRIYLGAPGQETLNSSYPATDIRVTGNTWSVARGASVPCTNGSAKDTETRKAPFGASGSAHPGGTTAASGSAAQPGVTAGAASKGRTATGSAGSHPSAAGSDTTTAAAAVAEPRSTGSSHGGLVVGAVLAVAAVAGGGALWYARRRPA